MQNITCTTEINGNIDINCSIRYLNKWSSTCECKFLRGDTVVYVKGQLHKNKLQIV